MGWSKNKTFTAYFKKCEICSREFKTTPSSSKSKTCSLECKHKRTKLRRVIGSCLICKKQTTSAPYRIRKYCSNDCRYKDIGRLVNEAAKKRTTWGELRNRKNAKQWFVDKYKQCQICEYDKVIGILELHHIDRNDKNNHISNLILLCPNCHSEDHFNKKDGQFASSFGRKNK
jgi:hypothetical protein